MSKRIKYIEKKRIILIVLLVVASLTANFALKLYIERIDTAAKELEKKTDIAYEAKKGDTNTRGFYVANIKEDLKSFLSDRDITSLTYEIDGESFYLDILVHKSDSDEYEFEIEKIGNPEFNIYARTNIKNVETIEYRTGGLNLSTVLKIDQSYNSDYFAMTEGVYYFLGEDIESINYVDEHFYYMTYNPNYKTLEEAETCSKDVTSKIDDFKLDDYYYRYGKINFLTDYYQKLTAKTFKVKDKCAELEQKHKEKEEQSNKK